MPLALAFAVLSVNGSATALGAVLAAFWLSRVVFTLVGGVVADRLPRRAVMLACDAVRAPASRRSPRRCFSRTT